MNTIQSRRALLAGAPAVAAAALAGGTAVNVAAIGTVKAGEVDPIFAAIAEHRRCLDHMFASYRVIREREADLPDLPAKTALVSHRMERGATRRLRRPS
jgi:hypothetical protein